MQNTLSDLVSTMRAGVLSDSNGSAHTPTTMASVTPDYGPISHMTNPASRLSTMGRIPHATSPAGPPGPLENTQHLRNVSSSSIGQPASVWGNFPAHSTLIGQGDPGSDFGILPDGPNFGFPPRQEMMPGRQLFRDGSDPSSTSAYIRDQPSPFSSGSFHDSVRQVTSTAQNAKRATPAAPPHAFSWPATTPLPIHAAQGRDMSLPPSRAESVGPDDILAPEEIINPLGAMSNMAELVEAAVKRAREEQTTGATQPGDMSIKRSAEDGTTSEEGADGPPRPTKKTRFSSVEPTGPTVVESQNLPPKSGSKKGKGMTKRTHIHAYPDVVAEGFVSEEEGKALMDM